MPCGCADTTCACLITAGAGTGVSGSGTLADPYVVTGGTFVRKSADTARSSTATSAADPHLTVSVAASTTYRIEAILIWNAGAGGFRTAFTAPAGATMIWTNGSVGKITAASDTTSATTGERGMVNQGTLVVAGTAGSLVVTWAQDTSNAAATTLRAGSLLSITKIA